MVGFYWGDYAAEFIKRAPSYWIRALQFAQGVGPPPDRPYQVEIHPVMQGSSVCWLRCVDCHGQFQRSYDSAPAELFLKLVDELAVMGVPSVVLSGLYSDPTTDKSLLTALLNKGGSYWGVKLHTYGLGLSSEVQKSIIRAAELDPFHDSYVAITKLTTDPVVYKEMCGVGSRAASLLLQEQDNLAQFFDLVESVDSELSVRINCRVTKLNGDVEHLADLLRWVGSVSRRVAVRFTTDYLPSLASDEYKQWFFNSVFLPVLEVKNRVLSAASRAGFDSKRISFRDVSGECVYSGSKCFNSLLFSAVSTGGKVYPCEGIASYVFQDLSYGDLRLQGFCQIWADYMAKWASMDKGASCPSCVSISDCAINKSMFNRLEHPIEGS